MTRDADPADKQGHRPTIHLPSGKKYKGEWSGNKMHGRGEMVYVNGDVYEGDWVANTRQGHGTFWRLEYGRHRAEYVGEWRDGKRSGFGVFHDSLGQRFEGDFANSKRHGRGRQTKLADARDEDYQVRHANSGQAESSHSKHPGVDVYEGDWVENAMTGRGVMRFANGDVFFGGWLDDEKHGTGVHLFKHKKRAYEGVWDRGVPRCGTYREAREGEAEEIAGDARGGLVLPGHDSEKSLAQMPGLQLMKAKRVETDSRIATLRACGAQ